MARSGERECAADTGGASDVVDAPRDRVRSVFTMTKPKAELAEELPPPRDQWVPKWGMKDPGTRIHPKRIEEMQARIFCGAPRPVAAPMAEDPA